jgi:hypothetical protein
MIKEKTSISGTDKRFTPLLHIVQTSPGAHSYSIYFVTGAFFSRI